MSFYELVIYIRNELELGTTMELITEHLLAAGWKKAEIDRAFSVARKTADMPIGAVTGSDLGPRRHDAWIRIGRGLIIFLLCILILFTVFSVLFNLGLTGK